MKYIDLIAEAMLCLTEMNIESTRILVGSMSLYAVISGDGISKEADFEGVLGEIEEKKGQNEEKNEG